MEKNNNEGMKKMDKHQRKHNRMWASILALLILCLSYPIVAPSLAQALGGNCNAWIVNDVGSTFGRGKCTSLNKDVGEIIYPALPILEAT
ncbi:hypothetical protein ALMA_0993 [Alloscardovia macacae]|uniref:Uncharacterized protein n=1 Tax=Alloscardovia macacae TaxID=1160091 RepID=A0A261F5X0_9BIFI|nr:hypothetical protein ALMA_0993 [Alloscardovia macacae]